MLNRIIRIIGSAACCALLLAGCSIRLDDPAPATGEAIGFSAGSALLLDDASVTKAGATLKTSFDKSVEDYGAANADNFFVFGAKTVSASRFTVFSGQKVSLQSLGANPDDPADDTWDYTDHRFWDTNATQYDLVAISGVATSADVSCSPSDDGPIKAIVTYDTEQGQADILAAGAQRTKPDQGVLSLDAINFQFNHIVSAVSVTIYNDSPSISVQLNYYAFRNIAIKGYGKVEQHRNGLATMGTSKWENLTYTPNEVFGIVGESPVNIGPQKQHYSAGWDLMVPQGLGTYSTYTPQLRIDYQYEKENPNDPQGDPISVHPDVTTLRLESIKIKGSDDYIDQWLPGKKYNYENHIRLGGGIFVNVSVTDWHDVPAETPGLTIW